MSAPEVGPRRSLGVHATNAGIFGIMLLSLSLVVQWGILSGGVTFPSDAAPTLTFLSTLFPVANVLGGALIAAWIILRAINVWVLPALAARIDASIAARFDALGARVDGAAELTVDALLHARPDADASASGAAAEPERD